MAITLSGARRESRTLGAFGLVAGAALPRPEPLRSMAEVFRSMHAFGVRQAFSRNEPIFIEGDVAQSVYKLSCGAIRLCRHTADGRRHIADFVLAGDTFGLTDVASHTFTAEALSEVTLTSYPKAQFNRLVASSADVRALLMTHLEDDLAIAQYHHFVLGSQNAKQRVVSFLMRLAARMDVRSAERIDLAMGRQDIADHLGLTIETVCRALATLKSEGMVTVPNAHQLILNDMKALREFAIAA